MNAMQKAIKITGGRAELAKRLGVTSMAIHLWLNKSRQISAERAIAIERATEGQVTRAELRPDLFGPESGMDTKKEARNA